MKILDHEYEFVEEEMTPYDEGWQDGYDGNYANPYAKQEDPERWLDYRTGFEHGQQRFAADESTPLSEQIALAEEEA